MSINQPPECEEKLYVFIPLNAGSRTSTGVVATPLMFLFFMLPLFAIIGIKQLEGISKAMPTYYYLDIMKKVIIDGKSFAETFSALGILAGSTVLASVLLLVVCKKKGLE